MVTFILVPGHNTSKSTTLVQRSNWQEFLKQEVLGSDVNVYYSHYDMFDHNEVENSINGLVNLIGKIDTKIILLSYSFGGFISRLALQRLPPNDLNKISTIVTMGTPFIAPNLRQRKFLEDFSLMPRIEVPMIAFGGWLDPFAFPLFIKPKGKDVAIRYFLFCTHRDFFFSKRIRNRVVEVLKAFLRRRGIIE